MPSQRCLRRCSDLVRRMSITSRPYDVEIAITESSDGILAMLHHALCRSEASSSSSVLEFRTFSVPSSSGELHFEWKDVHRWRILWIHWLIEIFFDSIEHSLIIGIYAGGLDDSCSNGSVLSNEHLESRFQPATGVFGRHIDMAHSLHALIRWPPGDFPVGFDLIMSDHRNC